MWQIGLEVRRTDWRITSKPSTMEILSIKKVEFLILLRIRLFDSYKN